MAPTEADEAAFMNDLMQGLEDDFWTAAPTPDPSPVKKLPLRPIQPLSSPRTPTRHPKQHASETSSFNPSVTSVSFSATGHDVSSFLQGSENWDLDTDPFSSPMKPQKFVEVKKPSPSPPYIPDPCTRCIVESVTEEYVDSRWRKTVIAKVDPGVERVEVFLCDDWYQTDIRIDDTINAIGIFSPSKSPSTSSQTPKRSIYITSQSNFLILHPDLLLTATALSNAPQCRRKPLLSSLVRSTSDTTPSLVWGSMLHEVMQRCLLEQQWDEAFIDKCIDETVLAGLGELVKLGLSEDIAKREVNDRAMGLKGFAGKYLAEEPKENGELTNTRSGAYDAPSLLAINRILDVEEEIVSPTYGIKGKLDATVQGIISDPILSSKSNPYSKPSASALERKLTHTPFPLELKTGRPGAGMEHRAQTMLYTVLLSERYGADVQDGLLFYTQSANGELIRVPRGRNEIRGLLGVRNDLVASMWKRIRRGKMIKKDQSMDMDVDMEDIVSPSSGPTLSHKAQSNREEPGEEAKEEEHFLPPPIDDQRACQRCYAIDTCFLFRKIHPNHNAPLIVGSAPQSLKAQKLTRKFDPPVPDFLADAFAAKTAHLTPARVEFFAKWERLLALEERDLVRFKRELWTIGAEERQKRGRCFAGMVLVPSGKGDKLEQRMSQGAEMNKDGKEDLKMEWGKEGKIHRFTYTFMRSAKWTTTHASSSSSSSSLTPFASQTQTAPAALSAHSPKKYQSQTQSRTQAQNPNNLLNGYMSVGDPITVSVEPKLLALARGYILELTPQKVVLGVDHVLDLDALRERVRKESQAGRGGDSQITAVDMSMSVDIDRDTQGEEVIFRIDKDELFGGMARVRNNLAQMFYADGDRKRLELVVDLRKPVFSAPTPPFLPSSSSPSSPSASSTGLPQPPSHLSHLNPPQLSAMQKVLEAEDYALVLGMPGTGKTTVIAELIRELVRRDKSVLLSSYTHSAVDTILMKLESGRSGVAVECVGVGVGVAGGKNGAKDGLGRSFGILRLGNVDKVHPAVRKYTLAERRKPTTVEQYEKQLLDAPVVATTCLSTDHALFSRRKFDYCIIDEASQITLPTCLGPLRFADTFILVGDHFQLPPLVKNPEARKGGLDVSLFRRLSEAHPEAVVDLRFQYRMNEDIMYLSNRLIYDDRLRCGNEEVRNRALVLSDKSFLGRLHNKEGGCEPCWLGQLVDESCKAVFVDTDALSATESRVGDLVQNTTEAELVRQFTETLLHCGVSESQIGVISLYRQQVKLLQHLLQERKGVEILTADKSQGRDKDCVIVSLVRSNDGGHIGELVKDWRRMNVSFTRARSKLVIFGSRKTLQREPLLAQFFELMQARGWILQLQPGAHTAHERVFGVAVSPATPTRKRSVSLIGYAEEQDDVEILEAAASMHRPHQPQSVMPKEENTEDVEIVEDCKVSDQDVDEDVEIVDEEPGPLEVSLPTTAASSCCHTPSSRNEDDDIVEIVEESLTLVEPHLKLACKASYPATVPTHRVHNDDDDNIEIVEVKKPLRKATVPTPAAAAVKPKPALAPAPRKPAGKENTLMEWLNMKEKPKDNSKLISQDKKKPKEKMTGKDKDKEDKARPRKKAKVEMGKNVAGANSGVLKGRPILRDLVGNEV